MIKRLFKAIKRYGIRNCIVGGCKYIRNSSYQKKYGFDKWHLKPIELRPYSMEMVDEIGRIIKQQHIEGPIVEIGCGLGEILAGIKCDNGKYGYDLSEDVIDAANHLNKKITFAVGTFPEVKLKAVGVVIFVNFIHNIPPKEMKGYIETFLDHNVTQLIVLDTVTNSESSHYKYTHDTKYLFEGLSFQQIRRTGPYLSAGGAKRFVEYWLNK